MITKLTKMVSPGNAWFTVESVRDLRAGEKYMIGDEVFTVTSKPHRHLIRVERGECPQWFDALTPIVAAPQPQPEPEPEAKPADGPTPKPAPKRTRRGRSTKSRKAPRE